DECTFARLCPNARQGNRRNQDKQQSLFHHIPPLAWKYLQQAFACPDSLPSLAETRNGDN
ncbi:MAG: hypothetical protein LLF89_06820, partial [Spirochaetaceae bacterium]|nr:hypothetical protein [Spirochaetaceae bacterium]